MRLGVFGGTFDPVHMGHLAAAEEARLSAGLDEILFIPAARPPHKPGAVVAAADDRLAMVRLAVADHPAFAVSAMELERAGPSYTSETLRALAKRRPNDSLFLMMGSDSLREIGGWHEPEEICRLAVFLVMVRPGWPRSELEDWVRGQPPERRPRVRFVEMPGLDISSRDLRRRLGEGQGCRYLLPAAVREYVGARGVYGAGGGGVGGGRAAAPAGGPVLEAADAGRARAGGARAGPDPERVRAAVRERLSERRAAHCERVAETARRLAERHGLDPAEAELAGLLHDWCREDPVPELLAQARALGAPLPEDPAQLVAGTLHGPVAARLLAACWPGLSAAVLGAVDRHTTGDPAMTSFDCLVYLADMLEPAHDFPGAWELRALADRDLRAACAAALGVTLAHVVQSGRPVDGRAVQARNALLAAAQAGGA